MTTILLSGVGALGGWALEFLARSPGVDRIVTVKRNPWSGAALPSLASIGAVFQGHTKRFEHHQVDVSDVSPLARLLAEVKPDVVLHSATVRSPRRLMNATVDPGIRSMLSQAPFGLWLPRHLLPAARLTEAVARSGVETKVVNASFPDVVNPAIWAHHGHGPVAGAGNVEVCVAQVLRYLVDVEGEHPADVEVSLVGSHALLGYGAMSGPNSRSPACCRTYSEETLRLRGGRTNELLWLQHRRARRSRPPARRPMVRERLMFHGARRHSHNGSG